MINPNTFITIRGKTQLTSESPWIGCEITVPIKNIRNLDKTECIKGMGEEGYFIRMLVEYQTIAPTIRTVLVDAKTIEWLKGILAEVNFDAPLIDTTEQIRVIVKDEVKKAKDAIQSLEV